MEVTVEHYRKKAVARVVDTQFCNPERKRNNPEPSAAVKAEASA